MRGMDHRNDTLSATSGLTAGFRRTTRYVRSAGSPTSRWRRYLIDSTRCIPRSAVLRSRPKNCCARCCCGPFIRSLRTGSSWSRWTTTCCSAGSSACRWMSRSGSPRCSAKPGADAGGEIAAAFMDAVLNQDEVKTLLSAEHFSVDGTLIQAWASMKSFRRKDGKDEPPAPAATERETFIKRSGQTRPMLRRPTLTRASPARAQGGGETIIHRASSHGKSQRAGC
jgi:hypothetical protein